MRARFIYEKFTQNSDPIKDLGIGSYKYIYDNLKAGDIFVFKKDIRNFGSYYRAGQYIRLTKVQNYPESEYDKRVNIQFVNKRFRKIKGVSTLEGSYGWGWNYKFFREFFEPVRIKESLNEKFTQDSDPIQDIEIGNPFALLEKYDIIKIKDNVDLKCTPIKNKRWKLFFPNQKPPSNTINSVKMGIIVNKRFNPNTGNLYLDMVMYSYISPKDHEDVMSNYDDYPDRFVVTSGNTSITNWRKYFDIVKL